MTFEERRGLLLPTVMRFARAGEIEFKLLDAIIITESHYDQWATRFESHFAVDDNVDRHARYNGITRETEVMLERFSWGLGQIMGGTARWLGYADELPKLCSPETNLGVMVKLIQRLQHRYTQDAEVIAAYNAGSVRVKEDGKFINQFYVDKVYKNMQSHVM